MSAGCGFFPRGETRRAQPALRRLQLRLNDLRLKLHPDKTAVLRTEDGLKFPGFVLRPDEVRVQQRTIKRFNRRLKRQQWLFQRGEISLREVSQSLRAWQAHVGQANSIGIRKTLWKRVVFRKRKPEK